MRAGLIWAALDGLSCFQRENTAPAWGLLDKFVGFTAVESIFETTALRLCVVKESGTLDGFLKKSLKRSWLIP